MNRYRAKYDFDVAVKICPMRSGIAYNDDFQDCYKQTAMMEILQECSNKFSEGKKIYQSLYAFDGKYIPSLDDIPPECKLILVSERPGPQTNKRDGSPQKAFMTGVDAPFEGEMVNNSLMIGLRNNKYEFESGVAFMSHQSKQIERSIFNKKKEWVDKNT